MRPAGKAQKRRNMPIFQGFATQPDGMQRRSKCKVIYLQALSAIVKRKQLNADEALAALKLTKAIAVKLVCPDISRSLEIALKFNIYAYDAYFLQCALSLSCPLLTLDRRMQNVARKLNITILE